jgi:putative ABC transport system ATP-binding protein
MNRAVPAIVQVKDVYKSYHIGDQEVPVLKGVSFDIKAGEFVAIVGESGNGKSTLLNMITGIDHPSAGDVLVKGVALHTLNENQLAEWRGKHLGIVFQFFQLLPSLNLLQNIILPMDLRGQLGRQARRDRAFELLDLVGLADQARKLPSQISGGQQQRAAIARALANDPPIVVADEPTGNLDSRTSADVLDVFCHLIDQGKTLVMVTHAQELAREASRRLLIENGRLADVL